MVLELDLERHVSEIVFLPERVEEMSKSAQKAALVKLGPYKAGRHLLVLPFLEGGYSWQTVSVPHFDLPFRLYKSTDERWRFSIEKERVNYVGQLIVRRERGSNSASVRLVNRIAATRNTIEAELADQLAEYPMRYAGFNRDRYFELYYPDPDQSE